MKARYLVMMVVLINVFVVFTLFISTSDQE